MKTVHHTDQAPAAIGPYSQAVQWGQTLYVSGQIALIPETGEMDNANLEAEVRRVLTNLQAVVAAAGASPKDVLKCTIFLHDMADFATVNSLYGAVFFEDPPARETVEVSKLPKNVQVEISCIAVR